MTATGLRDELIARLLALPAETDAAERALVSARLDLLVAERLLGDAQADLRLAGVYGKNTDERNAQLWQQTLSQRIRVDDADTRVNQAKVALEKLIVERRCLHDITRLISGGE